MAALLLPLLGVCWVLCIYGLHRRYSRHRHTHAWHGDVLAGGLLFWGVLAYFWRTLSGDVFQPADGGDLVSFLFPTYRFAAGQLAQGALPLWNPHLYGGAPFISDIQAGFFYPPFLALFVFWPDFPYTAMQWLSALHLYWAGLGMYVLLRTITWHGEWRSASAEDATIQYDASSVTLAPAHVLSRGAALLGAVAFQFSDPLLTHFGNLNLIAVLSWMPWVLTAFWRACLRDTNTIGATWPARIRWAVVAGVLFAVGNYAGHAQSSFYIGLALILLVAFHALAGGAMAHAWPRLRYGLVSLVITGGLTFLLTAPILLPAAELSGYTSRSYLTYQESIAFSLAPAQAIGVVTPGFFGRGPALHWSLWDRVETPYAGVAALLFAVGGLVLASADRRRLAIWLALGLFGFITALGVYAILHGWLAWAIPPFGQLRAPARALILWTLALSVLAAYGLDAVARRLRRPPAPPLADLPHQSSVDTSGVFSYLAFLRGGAWLWIGVLLPLSFTSLLLTQGDETAFLRASVATLALCIAAALWIATWALLAAYRAGWFTPLILSVLAVMLLYMDLAATGAYTDISSSDPTRGYDHPEVVAFLQADPDVFRIDTRTDMEHLWQPDTAALYGLQDVDGIANPLMLRHWREFWESTGGRHTRQYDLLNVKYVLVEGDTPLPEVKFARVLDAPTGVTVYENLDFHPRAWVVHHAEVVADPAMALARFAAGELDLTKSVLLAAGETGSHDPIGEVGETSGAATILHYGSGELEVAVSAAAPGYLVLSEVWYPGWRATVNGASVPVLRANYAQRAVPVPDGDATVRLWFWPRTWTWGLVLAGMGALFCVALLAAIRRESKHARGSSIMRDKMVG